MSEPKNSFDAITNEEFDDILQELATVPALLSIGDIYSEAREHYNNDVLEEWARRNNRCAECGAKLNESGDCTGGCDN